MEVTKPGHVIEAERVISVRQRRRFAVDALRQAMEKANGPKTPGELVANLAYGLVDRMSNVISELVGGERISAHDPVHIPALLLAR